MSTHKKFATVSQATLSCILILSSLEPLYTLDITWHTSLHHMPQVIHIVKNPQCQNHHASLSEQ
jgi:hypothetical protein